MTSQSFILSFFVFPLQSMGVGLLFRDDQDMSGRGLPGEQSAQSLKVPYLAQSLSINRSDSSSSELAGILIGEQTLQIHVRVLVAGNYTMLWTDTTRVVGWIQRYRTNTDMSRYLHHPEQRSKAAHSQRSPVRTGGPVRALKPKNLPPPPRRN